MADNPNDVIRLEVLKYLYEVHQSHKGTHRNASYGSGIAGAVGNRTGVSPEAAAAALHYLVDSGHANVREVAQGAGVLPMQLYSISARGVDFIEGESRFAASSATPSVTIHNRDGAVVVGDNNSITIQNVAVRDALAEIAKVIAAAKGLSEAARADALADLATVQAQVSKASPNREIIKTAWAGIEIAVNASGATDLLRRAAVLLGLL